MAEEENNNEVAADAEANGEETPAEAAAEAPKEEAAPAGDAEKPAASGEAAEAPKQEDAAAAETKPGKDGEKRDIFAEIVGAEEGQVKIHKAKKSKNVQRGMVHITATFNNTLVGVTDPRGNSIGWSSAGKMGFRGSRKSTAYAAQVVSQDACRQAMGHGLKEVDVRIKGPGSGREAAVRALQNLGLDVLSIEDVTPIPHNGCRPKKARRV